MHQPGSFLRSMECGWSSPPASLDHHSPVMIPSIHLSHSVCSSAGLLCVLLQEEAVLVGWLLSALHRQRPPAADLLPLVLATRWRATEALGAFNLWARTQPSGPGQEGPAAAATSLVDAMVNSQSRLLAEPQRNVAVPAPAEGARGETLGTGAHVAPQYLHMGRCVCALLGGKTGSACVCDVW